MNCFKKIIIFLFGGINYNKGFPVGNPELYSKLMLLISKANSKEEVLKAEERLRREKDVSFNLTVFEYRELRELIKLKRKRFNLGPTILEPDFWAKRKNIKRYL